MKKTLTMTIAILIIILFVSTDAFARAGGGKSGGMGSRGSKTYNAPMKSAPSPSSPSQVQRQQQPIPTTPAAQPSRWGGFMGMLAGGIIGGMIGNLLFSSLAHGMGATGGYGGPGLFDIILIGLIIFIIYRIIKSRRQQEAPAYSTGYSQQSGQGFDNQPMQYSGTTYSPTSYIANDVDTGISHIRQLDASFDERSFKETANDIFFKVQAAWMARNMDNVKHLLTQEMYNIMKEDTDKLKREGRINRLENIAIRNVEITEAWQEEGKDYITVEFNANVLDYITDEAGRVLEGSNVEPVEFVEYWTFTRMAGPNPWQLSAIQQE